MSFAAPAKKAVNLSANAELLREAKALNINLSQAFETHLAELVRARKQEQWLAENLSAIEAYNRRIEETGVFGDGWRSF
ncbi:MAG: type II toxin-antitoxin system CcdA family antitoxin [Methylococcus sp.]|nr:type II toxin-antitoxin system CcdA family antitoxin [Methylococcus sp.]